jgi:hypothetical protein
VKVGVLFPTTWQLVEKMAALFPAVEVVGPLSDDRHYWNNVERKLDEWQAMGLCVSLRLEPYDRIDFSAYDLLIESVETFFYARSWADHCARYECPVLLKACWTGYPKEYLPAEYLASRRDTPVLLEMPAHRSQWRAAGFTDVSVIYNPVGDWWFTQPWIGDERRIIFLLSGTRSWRGDDLDRFGFDYWQEIRRRFGAAAFHHDGHEQYRTSLELAELFSHSRAFVNLDRPYGNGERPLTLAFTEALSAGLPVAARDLPGLSYRQLIDRNGVCSDDLETLCGFLGRCLDDQGFAAACSGRSREIARLYFHRDALWPRYRGLIERAVAAFYRRANPQSAEPAPPVALSDDVYADAVRLYEATRPVGYDLERAVADFYAGAEFWGRFREWVNGPDSYRTFDRQFVEPANVLDGRRVLNVGCYYPWAEIQWSAQAARWVAIDKNPTVLARAAEVLAQQCVRCVHFVEADVTLPLAEPIAAELAADVLLDLGTFDQLDPRRWRQALDNYRRLAPRVLMAYDGTRQPFAEFCFNEYGFDAKLHETTVERLFEAAGFRVRRHEPFYYHNRSYIDAERRTENGS